MGGRCCGCFASRSGSALRRAAVGLGLLLVAACGDGSRAPVIDITLEEVLRLERPSDETDLWPAVPARGLGWYAALTMAPPGRGVAVFDSLGGFLRELRAQGRGPGEFDGLQAVGFGPGDSLWAVEMFRAHLFSPPPELSFVRTVTFAQPTSGRVTPLGFLSRAVFTSEGILPPGLREWDGTLRARFGPSGSVQNVDAEMGPLYPLDVSQAWKAHGQNYELLLVDSSGAVRQRLSRSLAWFPPNEPVRGAYNDVRPPSRIADLSVGTGGNLQVLIRRAHPDWQPSASGTASAPIAVRSMRAPSAASLNALFEMVLDVLDPASGALLGSRVLPASYRGFIDAQHLAEVVDDEDGHISIGIWRLGLVGGGGAAPPE